MKMMLCIRNYSGFYRSYITFHISYEEYDPNGIFSGTVWGFAMIKIVFFLIKENCIK